MANTAQSKKRARQSDARHDVNKARRSRIRTYLRKVEEALASGDAGVLRREAHTIKSMLATFSYESGRGLAEQLEHLAASGSLDGAVELSAQVVNAVKCLSVVLRAEMA